MTQVDTLEIVRNFAIQHLSYLLKSILGGENVQFDR
jgi:hypothetical protein